MQKFNFEKDLIHQENAVKNIVQVFYGLEEQSHATFIYRNQTNPIYNRVELCHSGLLSFINPPDQYFKNIAKIQNSCNINEKPDARSNIIDIMMETGTGKTYTYTKTIFELNKQYGVFKFIIVVPTLPIKAGTINFLKSDSCRQHFKEQYGKTIRLHIVESKKVNRHKKTSMPQSISDFVSASTFDNNFIHVLIINAGMINSDTMQSSSDRELFDRCYTPFDAIAAIRPWIIIDEPHKFDKGNKTWLNLQKLQGQFILRYGATFPDKELKQKNSITNKVERILVKDYHNLIYKLTAVDAFNKNLVKGIIGYITEFDGGKNVSVEFIDSNGIEATFKLRDNISETIKKLNRNANFEQIHHAMSNLWIEAINKSTVILSNGLELKKGDKLNPYSYAETLQETMIKRAVKQHFDIEKSLLTRDVKIKPLTLFFIDNINEYRNLDGYIRLTLEQSIKAEIVDRLNTEENLFFRQYLETALIDLSKTHAGYFSKDNNEKDELIEKELNEILHDKELILSLDNPRRFIFSKWTLREGWDNPNIFQICKLRSSGSEISKLQEVGRGLRLPVNEYGNRVKDEQFYLNYFVDFTESDFIEKLVSEINHKSEIVPSIKNASKLTDVMIKQIFDHYNITEVNLLKMLDVANVIERDNTFKSGGFEYIKKHFTKIFSEVNGDKIRVATDINRNKIKIRVSKYNELKELWHKLNQRFILEYKFESEEMFKKMLIDFLQTLNKKFTANSVNLKTANIIITDSEAKSNYSSSIENDDILVLSTMKYSEFLKELANLLSINIVTLHQAFLATKIEINKYLNQTTLRLIKHHFESYLMAHAIEKFNIEYHLLSSNIHPTKFTDQKGNILDEINASEVGGFSSDKDVAQNYFFNQLYFDSDLEKSNIIENIAEVVVFTKIPKNAIRIPISGGKSYSPDFAYVIKLDGGKELLYLIIETKDIENTNNLRIEELCKIKHTEQLFNDQLKIKFVTQLRGDSITNLIKNNINNLSK